MSRKLGAIQLDRLASANGLIHDNAHEAMSDAQATLDLARLIRRQAPDVWEAMYKTRSKQTTLALLQETDVVCFTDVRFGTNSVLATEIAPNPENSSEVAMFDLSHDPLPYLDAPKKDLASLLRTSPRPIRIARINQNPILFPVALAHGEVSGHGQSSSEIEAKIRSIRSHPTFANNVAHSLANRYPVRDRPDHVEQRIFESFVSRADSVLLEEFHAAPWEKRLEIVLNLQDERLREIGERLIYLEHPDVLPEESRRKHEEWCNKRIHGTPEMPWVTLSSATKELDELKAIDAGENSALLKDIATYLEGIRLTERDRP